MKYFLVLVVSAIAVALCNAECYRGQAVLDPDTMTVKPCMHQGIEHPLGSEWISDCFKCRCSSQGDFECCRRYEDPDCDPYHDKTA
ncbi:hypothetical protein NDU88_009289 [Pleurodeles waltl]|uniref:Uncharacterized protein n=1 Tax=Pleurodeles waltl TaxID=8319 RepID=A0AAV7QR47_PLEWA|nr:hypothetical protein NDU88_009289 [Pleurodeles waltl]